MLIYHWWLHVQWNPLTVCKVRAGRLTDHTPEGKENQCPWREIPSCYVLHPALEIGDGTPNQMCLLQRAGTSIPGFFLSCFLLQDNRLPIREAWTLYKQRYYCFLTNSTLTPEIHLLETLGHDQIPFPFQFLGLHIHGLWIGPSRAEEKNNRKTTLTY